MKLRIDASTPVLRRYLEVDEVGVVYCETSAFGGLQRISFDQIDAVLRDHSHVSLQVGGTIHRIPYNAQKNEHTQCVRMLVEGCRKTLVAPAPRE